MTKRESDTDRNKSKARDADGNPRPRFEISARFLKGGEKLLLEKKIHLVDEVGLETDGTPEAKKSAVSVAVILQILTLVSATFALILAINPDCCGAQLKPSQYPILLGWISVVTTAILGAVWIKRKK